MWRTSSQTSSPVFCRPAAVVALLAGCVGLFAASPQVLANDDLRAAQKALEAGKASTAIVRLNAAFKSQRLTPRQTARALYMRGRARLLINKQAGAISDLTSALWTKLLPADLQREAEIQRALAYDSLGVKPTARPAQRVARPAPAAETPVTKPAPRKTYSHKITQPILPTSRLPEGATRTDRTATRATDREIPAANVRPVAPSAPWQTRAQRDTQPREQSPATIEFGQPRETKATRRPTPPPITQPTTTASIKRPPAKPVGGAWSNATQPNIEKFNTTTARAATPKPQAPPAAPKWNSVTQERAPVKPYEPATAASSPTRPTTVARRPQTGSAPPPSATALPSTIQPAPPPAASAIEPPQSPPAPFELPNVPSLFGSPTDKPAAVAAADELQRQRFERIREHNRRLKAGTVPPPQ